MPFVYSSQPTSNITTSGTPNTEVDNFFLKPGARNVWLQSVLIIGKGAGLTAISGIVVRGKKYTTTAGSAGTAVTPTPRDPGAQACKATNANGTTAVTAGTGGPTQFLTIGCGAAGPGGWVAPNPDSMVVLEGSANHSLDLFNSSGTASLNFEQMAEFQE